MLNSLPLSQKFVVENTTSSANDAKYVCCNSIDFSNQYSINDIADDLDATSEIELFIAQTFKGSCTNVVDQLHFMMKMHNSYAESFEQQARYKSVYNQYIFTGNSV